MDGAAAHPRAHLLVGAAAVFVQHRFSYWLGLHVRAVVLPGPYRLPAHERVQLACACSPAGFTLSHAGAEGRSVPGRPDRLCASGEPGGTVARFGSNYRTRFDVHGHWDVRRRPAAARGPRESVRKWVKLLSILAAVTAAATASALHADSTDLAIASTVLLCVCALAGQLPLATSSAASGCSPRGCGCRS